MISDWKIFFDRVRAEPYSQKLHRFLETEYASQVVYPPHDLVFNAFALTSPSDLKAVIIGQDPYHNPGQAMGLSFSVPRGVALPFFGQYLQGGPNGFGDPDGFRKRGFDMLGQARGLIAQRVSDRERERSFVSRLRGI